MKFFWLVIVLSYTLIFLLLPKSSIAGKIDELSSMAKQGQVEAQFTLAEACYFGKDIKKNLPQAFFWYEKAAQQGHPKAQRALGSMYKLGIGTAKEPVKAAYWYQKSAEQGLARAQTNLGILYETGEGVAQNHDTARKWYEKAAEQGYARGQTYLGRMYELGIGVTVDYTKAFSWYEKAAQQGYARAQTNLGALYEAGQGMEQNYEQASAWYTKAAEQHYARGQFYLGRLYERGLGVEKNIALASEWYSKAAKQGYSRARKQLAQVKSEHAKTNEKIIQKTKQVVDQVEDEKGKVTIEEKGKETDQVQNAQSTLTTKAKLKEEAVQFTIKDEFLARAGDPDSQYFLGLLYLAGEGNYEMDAKKAAYWFSLATEKGNRNAQYHLGLLYLKGEGVEKDSKKGIRLLQETASSGNSDAQNYLGLLYLNGEGVEENPQKGMLLLEQAAESGNVDAQNNLGMYYLETDYSQAVVWFLKAAEQGLPDAQYNLASMYLAGLGVKQNKEQAIHWMQEAANQGYLIAMKILDSILEKKPETNEIVEQAAESDNVDAQHNLSVKYSDGLGVKKNKDGAILGMQKAANQGYLIARKTLESFKEKKPETNENYQSKRADDLYQQIIAKQQQRKISNKINSINNTEKGKNDTEETRTASPTNIVPAQNDKSTYAKMTRLQHQIERLTERIESGLSDREYDRLMQLESPVFVIHDRDRLEAYQAELDKLKLDVSPQ